METDKKQKSSLTKLLLLSLTALGVVYGDIGTSPLYTLNEVFFGHSHLKIGTMEIIGSVSLIFWAITLIVSFKYVVYVLQADYKGDGGVFALSSLIENSGKNIGRLFKIVIFLLIFAAGLLIGDGMITPAISVIAAVEGLGLVTRSFQPFIIPLTLIILTGLFVVQHKGTTKIGKIFGPIIIVWLLAISVTGFSQIVNAPQIFKALNPFFALQFVFSMHIHSLLLLLGSVMLAITGGEAMYADLAHFGKKPIRLSWFSLVYPALILNYFGQGAYLLQGKQIINGNIFFSMIPSWALIPMVLIATCAAVIASQALISGAYSLVTQAISLGYFPRLPVKYTHTEHEGQKYVSFINWVLWIGAMALVLYFQSSSRLASAYGLAVSGVMITTTLGMIIVSSEIWKWGYLRSLLLFVPFLLIESLFLVANSLKFVEGGFIPVSIALFIFIIIYIWQWGKSIIKKTIHTYPTIDFSEFAQIKQENRIRLPITMICMVEKKHKNEDKIPVLVQLLLDRYKYIPENLILLHVKQTHESHISNEHERFNITQLFKDAESGRITLVELKYGFMEEPHVEDYLVNLATHHLIDIPENPKNWVIRTLDDNFVVDESASPLLKIKTFIFSFLDKNSITIPEYFELGRKATVTKEVFIVKFT